MTTEQASAQAYLADARNDQVLVYVNGSPWHMHFKLTRYPIFRVDEPWGFSNRSALQIDVVGAVA